MHLSSSVEVASDRGIALAMRWVVQAAKGRSEKTMALRLAAELYEAYLGRGASVKIRDDVHRMAKATKHLLIIVGKVEVNCGTRNTD